MQQHIYIMYCAHISDNTARLDITSASVLGNTCINSVMSTPDTPKADANKDSVLSAVPTRLKTRLSLSSVTSSPQDKNIDVSLTSNKTTPDKTVEQVFKTPVSNRKLASEFVTPVSTGKGSPNQSAQFTTPCTQKTPSQQYTPYTPAPLMKKQKMQQETPKTPVPHVELSKMSPMTYQNYWSNKIPCNVPTPETPYGEVFEANPSPGTKKEWKQYLTAVPGDDTVSKQ
jgi:hypothetical protein